MTELFCGVDAGAATTKVVLVDASGNVLGSAVRRSGVDFGVTALEDLKDALGQAGETRDAVSRTISTGYGRTTIEIADETMTEIACHAAAVHFHFPRPVTVVDIGGQDNKIIRIDARGQRLGFRMNRKCAAGTGAFLEEVALRLDVGLPELDDLAQRASDPVSLGSFCTVFTKTEILGLIRQGTRIEDIAHGVYDSVVKRILEMDPLEGLVVMTGGVVEHNPMVARLLTQRLGHEVTVLDRAQLAGAFGAALIVSRRTRDGGGSRQTGPRPLEENPDA
ncbi:MAG: acyl-CoA dehydratase activase [Planctomycetota bacterium]|jgi:predicted CoA-substrate-specific enzyme activase